MKWKWNDSKYSENNMYAQHFILYVYTCNINFIKVSDQINAKTNLYYWTITCYTPGKMLLNNKFIKDSLAEIIVRVFVDTLNGI